MHKNKYNIDILPVNNLMIKKPFNFMYFFLYDSPYSCCVNRLQEIHVKKKQLDYHSKLIDWQKKYRETMDKFILAKEKMSRGFTTATFLNESRTKHGLAMVIVRKNWCAEGVLSLKQCFRSPSKEVIWFI